MNVNIDRRECFRHIGTGLVVGAVAASNLGNVIADAASLQQVRLGVVGLGPRGLELLRLLLSEFADVSVPAICDLRQESVDEAADLIRMQRETAPATYCAGEYEYRRMFDRDDLDGILVATDVQKLARIAVDAMNAGKNVAAEVTGAYTLEDCWNLVETKERTGKHYMLLEQCCYGDHNLMILNMLRQGMLGEPYSAECSYVHDVRHLLFNADQSLTWRGRMMTDGCGSSYSPHGMASVSKWLGINDGDRLESCTAMMSEPQEIRNYAAQQFGADSQAAHYDYRTGDFVTTLIRTARGKMIRLDYSLSNTRPYSRYYLLQGTQGCYDSRAGIYVQDADSHQGEERWREPTDFFEKYRHPIWQEQGDHARSVAAHQGMDYFCLRDFVEMVRHDREPWVDCYDTASWAVLNHCSELSICSKGRPVEIPDFTKGLWRDPAWRRDRVTPASVLPA